MSTLHLVRQSAFLTSDFSQCIDVITPSDTIVLMDDGCYNLNHPLLPSLVSSKNTPVCVIDSHAKARSMRSGVKVKVITMADMVNLTFTHAQVITWQ